jgi:hypothetical protein
MVEYFRAKQEKQAAEKSQCVPLQPGTVTKLHVTDAHAFEWQFQ